MVRFERNTQRDHQVIGDEVWSRFRASGDETLGYYRALALAYRYAGLHGFLVGELDRIVALLYDRVGLNIEAAIPL